MKKSVLILIGAVVILACLLDELLWIAAACEDALGCLVGIEAHVGGCEGSDELGQVGDAVFMDDEAVEGVAHADATGLGIMDDALALVEVAVFVEIGMNHASTCLYDWHLGIVAHEVDELSAATWYAHVDIAHSIKHGGGCLMGGWQELHHTSVDAMLLEHLMDEGYDCLVGTVGIFAALEHAGVATLETEGEDVEGYVRTCLEHHADDAEGH